MPFAKQDAAGEVGIFDLIKVDDKDVANAEEGKVLQHFIAEGTRPDDKDFCRAQFLLVPPSDETESAVTVVGDFKSHGVFQGVKRQIEFE